jgi:hypothetical protein
MSYHQTTELEPDQLRMAIVQAKRQEDAILAIFQRLRRPLTPSDVLKLTQAAGKAWPITSVRRAITDLEREQHELVKFGTLRVGPLGKPENFWCLACDLI